MFMIAKSKLLSVFLIMALALGALGVSGCGPNQLAKNSERVGKVARDVQPLFQSLIDGQVIPADKGAEIIQRCRFIEQNAPLLAQAFRDKNTSDIIELSAALIGVTEKIIAEDTLLIPVGAQRTTVLAVLVAADIALGIIADNLVQSGELPQFAHVVQRAKKSDAEIIKRFAKKPRLRARDARTGKFVSLDYARKHPETTVIERVK